MVKVCKNEYPKGSYRKQKSDGFYMDGLTKQQLDYYLKNIKMDWDFTIIVCGEGEVRVGKSFLACQIGRYWTQQIKELYGLEVPFDLDKNFVFDGRKLIERGNALGQKHKYSVLIFDEAGADLEGTKAMLATTRAVKDYLRECGQYNMLTILVLPEFFDLPKGIALSRSDCLINVYYIADDEGYFIRGYFNFYNRPNKKQLYLKGKKTLNYNAWKGNFPGSFPNFFPLDLKRYKKIKLQALKKRESTTMDKKLLQRNIAWYLLTEEFGMNQVKLATVTSNMGAYTIQPTIAEALKGLELTRSIMGKK